MVVNLQLPNNLESLALYRREKHPDTWSVEKKRRQWLMENGGKDSGEYVMPCHLCDQTWTSLGDLRAHWSSEHPGMVARWRLPDF